MVGFAASASSFYRNLAPPAKLPKGIDVLFPFQDPAVMGLVEAFFDKFYSDNKPRTMLIGINPGRFGAGKTGINFTAPKQLANDCGISHQLGNSSELSAEFTYTVIAAFGGTADFFGKFFIAAACPVGFVQQGRNLNYYDNPKLEKAILPYIVQCLQQQMEFGIHRKAAICIGGDKNFRVLNRINEQYHFFEELIPLPHPRFIMQYRRRSAGDYIKEYLSALNHCLHK